MTYTPGPWSVGERKKYYGQGYRAIVVEDPMLGTDELAWVITDWDETEPDAALIAAAPELLQACKAAHNLLDSIRITTTQKTSAYKVYIKLDHAIAKAEPAHCNECGGTGTVIVTSSPGFPEHGSIEQESCSECNGGAQ